MEDVMCYILATRTISKRLKSMAPFLVFRVNLLLFWYALMKNHVWVERMRVNGDYIKSFFIRSIATRRATCRLLDRRTPMSFYIWIDKAFCRKIYPSSVSNGMVARFFSSFLLLCKV